tara:strand:+ start:5350 stop:5619 length:270 start_codon:yes stop_codon:yes gene_type:complete
VSGPGGDKGQGRLPAALVAGPAKDALISARNRLTSALKEVQPVGDDMEPSDAMIRAIGDDIVAAYAALLPLTSAYLTWLGKPEGETDNG